MANVEAANGVSGTAAVQRTQIQVAEAAVQSRASMIQAELNFGYTTVRAPISGMIGKIQVDRGNLVGKSEPTLLATVSALDPIYVDFAVAEADYLRLAPRGRQNREARLELFLADDSLFPQKGRFVFVDRALDSKTGTIAVQAEFPNPARLLRPGQFARVRGVVDERPDAVLVPQLAVQEQQGAQTVLVVEEGSKVALRPVTIEERIGDLYVVTSGLKAGERVIVDGVQKVRPGMQVKAELKASTGGRSAPATTPAPTPAPPAGKPKGGG
jgi:membrane fusion protein (multidrug efflux system)